MSSFEQARATFQGELDSAPPGETLDLLPAEFPGPFVVGQALTIDGHGATFWALQGPVLEVRADRVTLRNLRIEVTGESDTPENGCALRVRSGRGLALENVEVRGSVVGLPGEEGEWRYPFAVQAGQLAHGREHALLLRLAVPVPCRIGSNISGLELEPHNLTPGPNEVRLQIERLPQDTLINGTLVLASAFLKRSILFSAHIVPLPGVPAARSAPVVWEPPDWAALAPSAAPAPAPPPPRQSVRAQPAPPPVPPPPPPPAAAPSPVLSPLVSSPRIRRTPGQKLGGAFSPPVSAAPSPPPEASPPAPSASAAGPSPAEEPAPPPELPPLRSSPRSVRMKPLSSIFGQPPSPDGPESKEEPPKQEPSDGAAPPPAPKPRKTTRASNISPLFGGAEAKPSDEEKPS